MSFSARSTPVIAVLVLTALTIVSVFLMARHGAGGLFADGSDPTHGVPGPDGMIWE